MISRLEFGHYALPEPQKGVLPDVDDLWMEAHRKLVTDHMTSARRSSAICDVLRQFQTEALDAALKCMVKENAGARARSRMNAALNAESAAHERVATALKILGADVEKSKGPAMEGLLLADIERISSGEHVSTLSPTEC